MKIFKLSQAHYKNPKVEELTPNQLRAIIVKEILVFPGNLPIIDEGRVKSALKKLKEFKDRGEIKEHIGTMIMDAIDHTMFETEAPAIKRLTSAQKTDMVEKAMSMLSRLMREVLKELNAPVVQR